MPDDVNEMRMAEIRRRLDNATLILRWKSEGHAARPIFPELLKSIYEDEEMSMANDRISQTQYQS